VSDLKPPSKEGKHLRAVNSADRQFFARGAFETPLVVLKGVKIEKSCIAICNGIVYSAHLCKVITRTVTGAITSNDGGRKK
jgi:hypothetical protein